MSASLRNAIKRKTHKERSQPASRRKLGLLEKHKDYVERARDYHRKEDAIRVLRGKARDRNPDEFYFKMVNSATRDGVHIAGREKANKYTQEQLHLMKTQDVRYVSQKRQVEQRKVEKLRAKLHEIDGQAQNRHTIFVDAEDDVESFPDAELAARSGQRKRGASALGGPLSATMRDETDARLPKRVARQKENAYRELRQRSDRLAKLKQMESTMTMQKELMGKGRRRKLATGGAGMGDDDVEGQQAKAPAHKWRRERKR
mmetsp:Transcript_3495/g.12602  ORF Transcript_3495/g.12602 Transcript_3495/m.12602 type:complete len:259 (-) Transcript_3495:15-791(-)